MTLQMDVRPDGRGGGGGMGEGEEGITISPIFLRKARG